MAKRSQRLKFRLEDGTVHDCEVEAGVPFVIGRGKEANLHLDFKSVSRQHCQLELDPSSGEVFVIDLGSQNGTRLNGKRITRAPLATGDDLLVATVPVKVELARKPKPTIERQLSPSEKQLRDQLLELGLEVHERIELGSPVPIFLARRTDLEQEVLVKAVRLGAGRDADEKAQRLLREAKLAAKVRHRNVVQIYDVRQSAGLVAIIFEAVDGRTLSQEIAKRGRLAPARAVGIGIELCAALEHAHSLGVVHRNITPSAVVVQKDGHVKLVDFGFAKSLAGAKGGPALTRQGQALGAVEYAPPEQVRDASAVDHRADIYAVGSTLYHALAGEPPLIKINPERLDDPSADVPATLTEVAPELPESVRRLVERAMKPDPAKRFQSAAELRAALEAVEAELEAGSTSGAFRAIEATARIVVGGSTAGSTGSGFLGRVQTDEMIELLQMVEHNRKSGTLEIHGSPDARGRRLSGNVAFREGRIVSASSSEHRPGEPRATAEHEGADAIYELLLLPSGNFRVIYGDVPAQAGEASIVISAMLMELMRRRDETKRAPLQ